MPLDRRGNLRVDVIVFVRPLDEPSPCWCEEHALPCLLAQHFMLMVSCNGEQEVPLTTLRIEGHE